MTISPDVGGPAIYDFGSVDNGVAANDNATGSGYIMFSAQDVHSRFGMRQDNSDHVIAVQLQGDQWHVSNNLQWIAFTPTGTDRLIASVDYSADTIVSMQGRSGTVNSIQQGYSAGDLVFDTNRWAGSFNAGEFTISGSYFEVADLALHSIGAIDNGIAANDNAAGIGYVLFTDQNVHSRFGMRQDNSDHLIAVQYSGGQWYVRSNLQWIPFAPVSTDRLIASLDFDADTINSLGGMSGTVDGIQVGFRSGDLTFSADVWPAAITPASSPSVEPTSKAERGPCTSAHYVTLSSTTFLK